MVCDIGLLSFSLESGASVRQKYLVHSRRLSSFTVQRRTSSASVGAVIERR
jgi:hypothetical protein